MSTLRPGDVICDRFRLERIAGSGGMGAVFRAEDLRGSAPVALKVFTGTRPSDAERFEREARVLAELRHPGVVRYVAHGATSDGERWLAMEWLEGETLNDHLRGGRAMDVEVAIDFTARVAEALAFAHARGIVHRDVKPSNVFLVDGAPEKAKLVDFGVAHLRRASVQLTQTGAPIGTPTYMAPEQARGAKQIDARADVFALGCVLYRCLTGRRAFAGNDVTAVLTKVLLEEVPRVSETREVPRALDDLVARMLSKDPSARPIDGGAVQRELHDLSQKQGVPRSSLRAPRSSSRTLGDVERRFDVLVMARAPSSTTTAEMATAPGYGSPAPHVDVRATAERLGGSTEILADGSVVVVFEPTGAATDRAARAARCALALRPLLTPSPIVVTAGRGEGDTGPRTGEAIDRAVTLLARATSGEILLDDATAALLDARFEVVASSEGPSLRAERDLGEMFRTVLGRRTECVGRTRELGTLEILLRECVDESVARVALVLGPAGIGKSRLRQEFVRRVKERAPELEVWIGRGDPMRVGSPFALLAPALRRAAEVQDGEPMEKRQQRLAAFVARSVAPSESRRVTEFLGEMIGVHFDDDESTQLRAARSDAAVMGDQMLRAWLDLVDAQCVRAPLLLVLDDVHWGDMPSVRFVDAALRASHDRRLMVLALGRPEVHDVFPRLWSERDVQEIRLSELTKRAAESLVRQVLGERVDDSRVARIVQRAAGNAFFLEELIRASVGGGDAEAPGTVIAMVQARLEALQPQSRRVLRAASVFGETFRVGGVVTLVGPDDGAQIDDRLDELVERELVVPRPDAQQGDERAYRFRHALVRDAAYALLTDDDRRTGHRLAAEWLAASGETDAAVLAEHLERGGEPKRAIHWYCAATEQALEANDFAATIERGERAIRCGADRDVRGALRAMQSEAHRWRGELAETERCAQEAMQLLPVGTARWSRAAAEAAGASGPLGHREQLLDIGAALLAAITSIRPRVTREPALHTVAAARVALQLMHAAEQELADRLLATMVDLGDANPLGAGHALRARAIRVLYGGDGEQSLRHLLASREAFLRAGDVRTASVVAVDIGFNYNELGAWPEAERVLRMALCDGERLGLRTVQGFALNNLPLSVLHQGRVDEALDFARRAVDLFAAQGDKRFESSSHLYVAAALVVRGDHRRAEFEARRAVALAEASPPTRMQALASLAMVLLESGRADEAHAVASEGYALLESIGAVEEGESLMRLAHALALHALGHEHGARSIVSDAHRRVRARAQKIADPRLRASFEAIPENARIARCAREWCAEE